MSSSADQQTFKNENLTVVVTRQPECRIHLDVTTSPLATQAAYQKAVKAISKEVLIPGFRKGKAPQETIIKNYGKHVEREWKDLLLDTAFRESIQLIDIYPFNKESIFKASIKHVSQKDGAELIYEYESAPVVPTVQPEELSIKQISKTAITENDLSETIEAIQLRHAGWNDVTDRPVIEGDYVDIDIYAKDLPEPQICKNQRFAVAPGKMGTWMRHLVVGMKPGDSAEGVSEKEPDEADCKQCEAGHEHHEHDHFTPTHCRITLHAIKTPALPALNDEFAVKLGLKTIEDLKPRVEADLNKQAEEEYATSLRSAMEQEVLAKYPFEVPHSLTSKQVESQTEQIIAELQEKGLENELLNTETQNVKRNVSDRLTREFRLYFLTEKIARDHNITVSQDEIMQEMMHQMWLQPTGKSIIHKQMEPQEVQARLYAHLLICKAMDYLIANAKVSE